MQGDARAGCPPWFKTYMLDGDFWRAGKRVVGQAARFTGFTLHRSTSGTDGQEGPRQFTTRFLEFLEQGRVDEVSAVSLRNTAFNLERVEAAMVEIQASRPEEIKALRFYLIPEQRREMSVQARALDWGMSVDKLRDDAIRGVALVWDEIGGAWAGTEAG